MNIVAHTAPLEFLMEVSKFMLHPRKMSSRFCAVFALGAVIILLAPTVTVAGEDPTHIRSGSRVRITAPTVATKPLVGTVISLDSSGVALQTRRRPLYREDPEVLASKEPQSLRVPWEAITQAELGRTKWGGKRTVVGAGIGLLSGAVFGSLIGLSMGSDSYLGSGGSAFFGAVFFGGGGVMVGALVGALPHERWQRTPVPGGPSSVVPGSSTSFTKGSVSPWSCGLSVGYSEGLGEGFAPQGSVSASAEGYYSGRWVGIGIEGGYHGLGTESSRTLDLYGPGTSEHRDVSRSASQATVAFRVRRPSGKLRPYAIAGAGAYFLRTQYETDVRDATGAPMPRYQWLGEETEAKPGFNVGAGMVNHHTFGRVSLGFHARWHGMFFVSAGGGEVPSFLTLSAAITMD